jgi:hypothetical protein
MKPYEHPGRVNYVTGSLGVWTLMDYFGEPKGQPHAWPHVSCDFGNFDIAGFPKPHAYWSVTCVSVPTCVHSCLRVRACARV